MNISLAFLLQDMTEIKQLCEKHSGVPTAETVVVTNKLLQTMIDHCSDHEVVSIVMFLCRTMQVNSVFLVGFKGEGNDVCHAFCLKYRQAMRDSL